MSAIRIYKAADETARHPIGLAIFKTVGDAEPVGAVEMDEEAALGLIRDLAEAIRQLHADARETIANVMPPGGASA